MDGVAAVVVYLDSAAGAAAAEVVGETVADLGTAAFALDFHNTASVVEARRAERAARRRSVDPGGTAGPDKPAGAECTPAALARKKTTWIYFDQNKELV